jgi:predicted nucleotidyltransferase
MGAACPEVEQVVLFGSFARNDYGVHSDLDLLVILDRTEKSVFQRLDEYLRWAPAYPTDILPLTRSEVQSRLERSDPFLRRVLNEGITLYSRPAPRK